MSRNGDELEERAVPVRADHQQPFLPGPARGEGLAQPGPVPVGAGRAMVDGDPLRRHPEAGHRVVLRGQVLTRRWSNGR